MAVLCFPPCFSCLYVDHIFLFFELRVLHCAALVLRMHGDFLREDHEKGSIRISRERKRERERESALPLT